VFLKYKFDLILGLIFLIPAVLSMPISTFGNIPKIVRIGLIALIIIIYVIIWFLKKKEENKVLAFQQKSNKFFEFFEKWYSRSGKLKLFCSNLDWMIHGHYDLVNTICKKGSDCSLYLKEEKINPDIRARLVEKNVKIFQNNNLLTTHRFSLLEEDNSTFLIICDKKNETYIEVKEESNSSNPYIITVVKDLLNSIEKVNNKEKNE